MQPVATAIGLTEAIDAALGITTTLGLKVIDVPDYNTGAIVGRLTIAASAPGWETVQAQSPRQVQQSRRITVNWNAS